MTILWVWILGILNSSLPPLFAVKIICESPAEKIRRDLAASERLLATGNYDGAVDRLTAALIKNPDNGAAREQIYQVAKLMAADKANLKRKNRPAEPKAEARAAAAPDSAKAETHYQKGLVYYSLRNYREAFNEFKLAVRYDPNSRKITQALQRVQSDLQK